MSEETIYFMLHKILHFEKFEDRIFDLENKNVELEVNLRILQDRLDKLSQNNGNLSEADTGDQIQSNSPEADDVGSNFVENPFENDKISVDQDQEIDFNPSQGNNPSDLNSILTGSQDGNFENQEPRVKFENNSDRSEVVNELTFTSRDIEDFEENLDMSSISISTSPEFILSSTIGKEIQIFDGSNQSLQIFKISAEVSKILQNVVVSLKRVDLDPNLASKYPGIIKAESPKSDTCKMPIQSSGTLDYQCKICSKFFKCQASIDHHMKVHKRCEGKAFKCSTCSMAFNQKVTLKIHQRIHTGEKPYSCSVCPKRFSQSYYLVIHSRTHTGEKPYICTFCPKKFAYGPSLVLHKRTHTGEKPFVCKFCPKKFPYRQSLILHTRSHTGEKPYNCPTCSKKFLDQSVRNQHVKSAHK